MNRQTHSTTDRRRVAVFGLGPLPEAGSTAAPGVANRLWHFVQPTLAAGHECLVVSIENDAPAAVEPATVRRGEHAFQLLRARPLDCKDRRLVAEIVRPFAPDVLVGAGTLLAGAAACAAAGDRPVWADLFGDPLAEIQAKAAALGAAFQRDNQLEVWKLMLAVLTRADRFSTVSRRQVDALVGQLGIAGRLEGAGFERIGDPALLGSRSLITTIPCGLESLDLFGAAPPPDRAAWLSGNGLPPDARVALWSGAFNAWVDAETLARGMEAAMDRDPSLWLVVTGGAIPNYVETVYQRFESLARASRHAGRMRLLGWIPLAGANDWLRVADVGLLADRPCAETRLGARNRLLYHASARCPVVASRGAEVVEDMERAGALAAFPTGDGEAMAHAIGDLLGDPVRRRAIGERSYSFCNEHYTFGQTGGAYLDFLARPERIAPAPQAGDESGGTAAEWIARYLDMDARLAEWAELDRCRRAGPLTRLRRFLNG